MKKALLAAIPAVVLALFPLPSFASPAQERTTTCNIYDNGALAERNVPCKASFWSNAHNPGRASVVAINFYSPSFGKWMNASVFASNASLGNTRECIRATYRDGSTNSVCTVPSAEQLGL